MEAELAAAEMELDAVEGSLVRMDAGTYGTCHVCGARLDDGLLAADPTASRCQEHQPEN